MKKILLLICFLMGSLGISQTIVEDFDPVLPSTAFQQDNNQGTVTISQVADPEPGGTRGNVLKLVTTASAPWQGAALNLQSDFIDLTDDPSDPDEKKVKIWVYYSNNGQPFNFLSKVSSSLPGVPTSATEAFHSGTGWEQLTFDFANNKDNTAAANGIYSKITFFPGWDSCPNAVGCYPGSPLTPGITMYIDEISYGPEVVPCNTNLGSTSTSCDALLTGETEYTYTASVGFTGGNTGNNFVISASAGVVGGDSPNNMASGTITVTDIPEGTDLTVTLSDTASGGSCDLSTTITSPICATCDDGIQNNDETGIDCGGSSCEACPLPQDLVEDFDDTYPVINFANDATGNGNAIIIPDPTGTGRGDVLQVVTAANDRGFQQAEVTLQGNTTLNLDANNGRVVSVDWYSEVPLDLMVTAVRNVGAFSAAEATHSGNGWETLIFDFTGNGTITEDGKLTANGSYNKLFFFPLWDIDKPRGGVLGGDGWFVGLPSLNGSIATTTLIDNIYQGEIVRDTYTYGNDVWLPTDPTGISGAFDNITIESGSASINANTNCGALTVKPGATLTLEAGATVIAERTNLLSTSTQYANLITLGTLEGPVTYDRHVNGHSSVGGVGTNNGNQGANDLIASPVASSQNFGEFARVNANLFENSANTTEKMFGPFDKDSGTYLTYDVVENASAPIESGVGYRAGSSDNSGFKFRGNINQTKVPVTITNVAAPFREWNLVGNPYTAYINVEKFLNHVIVPGTTNLDVLLDAGSAIYGYDGDASNGWTILNLNNGTENLAPGQGFFIPAELNLSTSAVVLEFTPDMMVDSNSDDFIVGRFSENTNAYLKLKAVIGGTNRTTEFYFNENSTSGLDPGYDAALYGNPGSKELYSNLVEENDGTALGIQSLAYSSLGSEIAVPLGINAPQGNQVTVSIQQSTIPDNFEIYLEDTVAGTYTLLNTSDYVFTTNVTLNSTGRFFLRFVDGALSTNEQDLNTVQIYTTNTPSDLFIKGQLFGETSVQLYDIQGREVLEQILNTQELSQQIGVSHLQAGLYIVELKSKSQTKTQKVIIR